MVCEDMRVLAIETSCDETAAAVVELSDPFGTAAVRVLSSVVASQADLHARTAGVVPEVAARAHVEAITFVVDDALTQAVGSRQQAVGEIDAVAATTEPGLRPALVIGETSGRALAAAWDKPFLPVNHLAGHLAAAWLVSEEAGDREFWVGKRLPSQPAVEHKFPAVALVVSGGHTQLWRLDETTSDVERRNVGGCRVRLLGQTRDDAAGEAFDKIARLLGLPYPGGPALAALAEQGDARACSFPRPMVDSGDLNFSFSGLKTAVFYAIRNRKLSEQERADVAASAQAAIVDVLVSKTVNAAGREGAAEVILTGGVAANTQLRERLQAALGSLPLVVPHPQYCTDNAAMIGAAAALGFSLPQEGRTQQARVR